MKREEGKLCCIYGASLGEGGSRFWPCFFLIQLLHTLSIVSLLQPAVGLLSSSSEGAQRNWEEDEGGARHTSQDVTLHHAALCIPRVEVWTSKVSISCVPASVNLFVSSLSHMSRSSVLVFFFFFFSPKISSRALFQVHCSSRVFRTVFTESSDQLTWGRTVSVSTTLGQIQITSVDHCDSLHTCSWFPEEESDSVGPLNLPFVPPWGLH